MGMGWQSSYLDLILVPLALSFHIIYHCWLWRKYLSRPHCTSMGVNGMNRRLWVLHMLKDNDKKSVLVVQSIRNVIMGSTLMATTSILFSTGLGALLSSTYSIKKPLADAVFGAHGDGLLALKYTSLLALFLLSFLCHSLAIRFVNAATFAINASSSSPDAITVSPEYCTDLLERGILLNTCGNRVFYAGLPLLLWILGPVLAFISAVATLPVLYNLDMVDEKWITVSSKGSSNGDSSSIISNGRKADDHHQVHVNNHLCGQV